MHTYPDFFGNLNLRKEVVMTKDGFRLNYERKESINKTVRFPQSLVKKIEKIIEGKQLNFSQFVIQACEYAISNLDENRK